ncbi:MAG TPA: hypothetical protein VHA57_09450, partial [Actinomycetota bacterium]|nr:hypothetical protein [Actinomycetota bacterium]
MADKVRYVMRKNETYDVYLRDLVAQRGYGRERHYAGVADQPTADQIRKALRNAGRHLGISVKAYWQVCDDNSCPASPCNYHVVYSAYDPA